MREHFAAVVIGRRSIAVAIYTAAKLEFWEVRSFHASPQQASNAVTSLLNRVLETFNVESVGLPQSDGSGQTRTTVLTDIALDLLRQRGVPVLRASEAELLAAYGEPHLRSRAALRRVASNLFAQLRDSAPTKELLDAAILGLHVQTERLLRIAESSEYESPQNH